MNINSLRALLLIISIVVIKPITSNESDIYCFIGDAGEVNPTQAVVVEALANSDCSVVWHLGDITQLGRSIY
jgi:hypothetical protein